MSNKAGLWVDHRQAIIVHLVDDQLTTETIASNIEKHVKAHGGSRTSTPYAPQEVVPEDRIDRKYNQHLEQYYQKITQAIGEAGSIYILGPGEVKNELTKHLQKKLQSTKPRIKLETTDKMSEAQIIAQVKLHYALT